MTAESAAIEILLVEDSLAEVRLTIEALKDAKVRNHLHVAMDGVEAMALLTGTGERRIPLPDLILLDINLPRKDGREVLDEIKQDDRLRHIPVVILTTSQARMDVMRSYHLRANAFITKPVDVDQFFKVIKRIEQFWLEVVTLSRP
jgi:chemotaxis family two-component system response regulator Rcp1